MTYIAALLLGQQLGLMWQMHKRGLEVPDIFTAVALMMEVGLLPIILLKGA